MAKKKNGVVPLRLVVQRINGKLAATGQILIKATLWMRMKLDYGDYYILDLNGKVMEHAHRPGETGWQVACVEGKGKKWSSGRENLGGKLGRSHKRPDPPATLNKPTP